MPEAGDEPYALTRRRLRELLGDVEISIETAQSWQSERAQKTHAISSAVPIRLR